jgi:Tfp pilus assembly protein PilF
MGVWAGLRALDEEVRGREAAASPEAGTGLWGRWLVVRYSAVGAGCLALAWYVATDRFAIDAGAPRETGVGVVEWNTPAAATGFLLESGSAPQVFNQMRDGGYLIWGSGGKIKVFVDGRTDVYGEAVLRELDQLRPSNWDVMADKWGINTAVIPVNGFEDVVGYLAASKGWAPVHVDHRCVVFARDTAGNAAVIAKYRIDLGKPWTASGPEPVEEVEGWKRLIGGRGRPWYTQEMAASFMAMKSLGNSRRFLERTLERYPDSPRARAELAAIERFAGREAGGTKHSVGLSRVWSVYSERLLAGWLMESGRKEEAAAALERAVRSGAADATMRVALADLYFQANPPNFTAAKGEYERAVAEGVDTAAEWMKLGYSREKTGDKKGAEAAYRKSLARDERQYQVWYLLAGVLGGQGDRAGARAALEKCLTIKPDFEPAKRALEGMK